MTELKLFKEFKRLLTQDDIEDVPLFPKFTCRNMTILGLSTYKLPRKERLIINIASVNIEFEFQQVWYQAIQYPGPLLELDLGIDTGALLVYDL